jgi:hypothetical protein
MSMHRASWWGALLVALLVMVPRPAQALAIGIVDDFEDGTLQNWAVGILGAVHPFPPVNEPTGGPAGANDNFMRLTSTGVQGPGGRMAVLNVLGPWTGDYIAAGIRAIEMDVNNMGNTPLNLRLLIADPVPGPPVNEAISAAAVLVPAGSGWTHVVFPVDVASLIAELGTVENALRNATELRIFNNVNPASPGPNVAASLGVDNITAVPEPASLALVGAALAALGLRLKNRA